jgi:hypothetical protein
MLKVSASDSGHYTRRTSEILMEDNIAFTTNKITAATLYTLVTLIVLGI